MRPTKIRNTAAALFLGLFGCLVLPTLGEDAPPAAAVAAAAAQPAAAANPAMPPPPFEVFPADVNLETARDSQTIVALVRQPDGVTRDVTSQCQLSLENP